MGKLLHTERVGSDSRREVARFFFLEVAGNTDLKGKIDVGKHAILSYFLMVKTSHSNSRSKYTPHTPVEANSRRCSSLNCPVERSKFFCIFPAC